MAAESAFPESTPTPTYANAAYGPYDRNVLDFWKADAKTPAPLIIRIHGGGFGGGDKTNTPAQEITQALSGGASFAAINYRYRTTTSMTNVMLDIARSVQFLRSKATEWNVDKRRVAAYGDSAGAGAALWLAFHDDLTQPDSPDPVLRESTRLSAAGALAGQCTYNIDRWPELLGMDPSLMKPLIQSYRATPPGGKPMSEKEIQNALAFLDMLAFMDPKDPPIYLHSNGPDVVPGDITHHPRHAKVVKKRCDELGIPAVLIVENTPPSQRIGVIPFLLRHLKSP